MAIVPSLHHDGNCLRPAKAFQQHEIVIEVTGQYVAHRSLPECQYALNVQFGSPPSASLTLVLDRHILHLIHVTESEQPDVKNLIYLTPEWVFSTSANPVLRLRAPSDLQPFSSELALVFKVAGKADKKAGPCCFD